MQNLLIAIDALAFSAGSVDVTKSGAFVLRKRTKKYA
jgi:hypothetical protein